MSDEQTGDPQRDIERLKAELEDKKREIEKFKKESSHTKEVEDALWSHDIYLRARKKLAAGVMIFLGALSALGLVTVTQLYQRGVDYVDGELQASIGDRIKQKADVMVEGAGEKMNSQISLLIQNLIAEKKEEIETQATGMQQSIAAKITESISNAQGQVSDLVEKAEADIAARIGQMEQSIQRDADAVSERVKQMRIASLPQADAERVDSEIVRGCDSNYLDEDQVARVAVRQQSEGTGKIVRNGRQVFENILFLDVRGADDSADLAAQAACILDGVDRVVYGADPNWYRPSEFVRIDRENEFRFTISGWGPTELIAQVYFNGRRDPVVFKGHLAISNVAGTEKHYLDDAPLDIQ